MRDFFYFLKTVYAVLGLLALLAALWGIPIFLAIHFNPWWAAAEIVSAPVGLATLMSGLYEISN